MVFFNRKNFGVVANRCMLLDLVLHMLYLGFIGKSSGAEEGGTSREFLVLCVFAFESQGFWEQGAGSRGVKLVSHAARSRPIKNRNHEKGFLVFHY